MSQYLECKYCLKKFVSKRFYEKHECEQMKRHKLLRSTTGIAAYDSYCNWMKAKGFKVRGKEQFVDSRLFKSFIKFVRFAAKMALPGRERFIEYMAELDIHPKDWTQRLVYNHFIEEFDNIYTPEEQAQISVDTAFELSRIFECETEEIFLHIEPNALLRIIQAKKLSPWFLLFSSKFMWFVKNEMTREQRMILQKYVNADKWNVIFDQHPDKVSKMKDYVKALGL